MINYKQEAMEMFNDLVDAGFTMQSAADEVMFNYSVEDTPEHLLQYTTPLDEINAAFDNMIKLAEIKLK